MVKDKNKPKGVMSAYAYFVQTIRAEHKKKNPGESVDFSEFSKKCSEKWKTLTPKDKKKFEDMSAHDKVRHNKEMAHYVPEGGKVKKRTKDPNKPKKGLSAFFCFCKDERVKVRNLNPDWKVGDIAKELGKRWEQCKDRKKFDVMADADRKRYEKEMIKYNAGGGASKGGPSSKKAKAVAVVESDDSDSDE